jgi:hypothetical protein
MAKNSVMTKLLRALGKPAEPIDPGLDQRISRRQAAVDQAVAEAMASAGVLSSGYQHEARPVDPRGHQFVVTIDLPQELDSMTAGSLAKIGATISKKTKVSHAAEITRVYWRVEPDAQAVGQPAATVPATAPFIAETSTPAPTLAHPGANAASEKLAKLRESMKDDVEADSNQGFASTIIGFERGDKPDR